MTKVQPELQRFLQAVEDWGCDSYALDIRYLAGLGGEKEQLWEASISLAPLPFSVDHNLQIEHGSFAAGQSQIYPVRKQEQRRMLELAAQGILEVHGQVLKLPVERGIDYYTEISSRNRWFADLHLQVGGALQPIPSPLDLSHIDTALRRSNPPFDGLPDLAAWLGFAAPGSGKASAIQIRVGPPIDLFLNECSLSADVLRLKLHAHPKFDLSEVGLAVRGVPGGGLAGRKQATTDIVWARPRAGIRPGSAEIALAQADNALVMLMVGETTVRRHWLIDPARARNVRLMAVQHYDRDLRMIKQAVLGSTDADRFERGVASLLFLLGFSPTVQLETNSPDIIVTTPAGRLVLVECTTRIADFATKVGKLVDRRGSLAKTMQESGHPMGILAALVCALPRDQIASQSSDLDLQKVVLLAREDLEAGIERVRFPPDPDQAVLDQEAKLARTGPRVRDE